MVSIFLLAFVFFGKISGTQEKFTVSQVSLAISGNEFDGAAAGVINNIIPRSDDDRVLDSENLEPYVRGVLLPALIIGISFTGVAILSGLIVSGILLCHCSSDNPLKIGYSSKKRRFVFVILGLNFICLLIISCLGFPANSKITRSLLDENSGAISIVKGILNDGFNLASTVSNSFSTINTSLADASEELAQVYQSQNQDDHITPESLAGRLLYESNRLRSLDEFTVTKTLGSTPYSRSYTCSSCSSMANELDLIATQLSISGPVLFSSINESFYTIKSTLIEQIDKIQGDLSIIITEEISSYEEDIRALDTSEIDTVEDLSKRYNTGRVILVILILLIPILGAAFFFLSFFLKKNAFLATSTACSFFTWLLMALMLTVHLPVTILFSDVCFSMKTFESNGEEPFDSLKNYCGSGKSLASAFQLDNALDFRDQILPPVFSSQNVSEVFPQNLLGNLISDVDPVNIELKTSFTNDSEIDQAFTGQNRSTLPSFSPPNDEETPYMDLYGSVILENEVIAIHTNLTSINSDYLTMISTLVNQSNIVATAWVSVLDNLFSDIEDAFTAANCNFLYDAYVDLKSSLCKDMLSGFSQLTLVVLLSTIFAIPAFFITFCVRKRFLEPGSMNPPSWRSGTDNLQMSSINF